MIGKLLSLYATAWVSGYGTYYVCKHECTGATFTDDVNIGLVQGINTLFISPCIIYNKVVHNNPMTTHKKDKPYELDIKLNIISNCQ